MHKVTNENAKNLLAKLEQATIDCFSIPNSLLPENFHYAEPMQGSDLEGIAYNTTAQHGRSLRSIVEQEEREAKKSAKAHIKRRGTTLKIKNKEIWQATPERLEVIHSYIDDMDDMPIDPLSLIDDACDIDLIEPINVDDAQRTRNEDSFMAMLVASAKGIIGDDDNDNKNLSQFREGFNVLSRTTT